MNATTPDPPVMTREETRRMIERERKRARYNAAKAHYSQPSVVYATTPATGATTPLPRNTQRQRKRRSTQNSPDYLDSLQKRQRRRSVSRTPTLMRSRL